MTDNKIPHECYVLALAEMKNAELDKENPHFKSKYSTYAAVRKATNEALANNDLGLSERTTFEDGKLILFSEIRHITGEVVNVSVFPLTSSAKIQQVGSEMTYARRYNRTLLCGISSGDEDDGNGAQDIDKTKSNPPKNQWTGPLNKTVLEKQINAICDQINECTEKDSLTRIKQIMINDKEAITQARQDAKELYDSVNDSAKKAKERIINANGFPGDATDDNPFGLPPVNQ